MRLPARLWPPGGGALAGLAGGALWGLVSQLAFLASAHWEWPFLRVLGGFMGGGLLGLLLTVGLARLWQRWARDPLHDPAWAPGWTLGLSGLAAALVWLLAGRSLLAWPLLLVLPGGMFALAGARAWWERAEHERRRAWLWRGAAVALLLLGLGLRLSGLGHGLPAYINHCDTPKQLELIPRFASGDLKPPTSYPVGHIYLYAGLAGLWHAAIGDAPPHLTGLEPGRADRMQGHILAARALQAFLGALIPLLVMAIAGRLWGAGAGLLAGLLAALDPLHLTYSRQVMGDVPQTLAVLAALWLALRYLGSRRAGALFWCGICAGLAVAVKMYGGYVLLAGLAAWWLGRPRPWSALAWLAGGALAGLILATPYFFVDPASWAGNLLGEVFTQYQFSSGFEGKLWEGARFWADLVKLWEMLLHRLPLLLPLLALLGLGLILIRPSHGEKIWLAAALPPLVIILALRLNYLREWDLVILTPFLAMSAAVLLNRALKAARGRPWWRGLVGAVALLLLLAQGSLALGDAILPRLPDTMLLARRWLMQTLPQGGEYRAHLPFMHKYTPWPPAQGAAGGALRAIPVDKSSAAALLSGGQAPGWLLWERGWWESPPSGRVKPSQVFAMRHTYWEHTTISAYDLAGPRPAPELILPHVVLEPAGPAMAHTPQQQRQTVDLMPRGTAPEEGGYAAGRYIFARQPLPGLAFAALGNGNGSIFFAPGLGRVLKVAPGRVAAGLLPAWRSPWPLVPRAYRVRAEARPGAGSLWVGLFPRAQMALPLLARLKAWSQVEALAASALRQESAPPETSLFAAAALAAQGKKPQADRVIQELAKARPGWLARYMAPPAPGPAGWSAWLDGLHTLDRDWLAAQSVRWPDPRPLADRAWGPAAIAADPRRFSLWLPRRFLPGALRARVELAWGDPAQSGSGQLLVIGLREPDYSEWMTRVPLKGGEKSLDFHFAVPQGPLKFELRVETSAPCRPAITQVLIQPDLAGEMAWRRQLLAPLAGAGVRP